LEFSCAQPVFIISRLFSSFVLIFRQPATTQVGKLKKNEDSPRFGRDLVARGSSGPTPSPPPSRARVGEAPYNPDVRPSSEANNFSESLASN